jgi:hypothetical protein
MLTLLGSPAQLLRSVNRACAKFTTVADMRLLAGGRRCATVSYRLRPGYQPNLHDCDLNIGLLSHIPATSDCLRPWLHIRTVRSTAPRSASTS